MFKFVYQDVDFAHKSDNASSPFDEYEKHMHSFFEILLFVKGDVDYHVEKEVRHLKPGDIVLINPGDFHFATVNKNVLYERYVLKFPASFITEDLQKRVKNIYPFFSTSRFTVELFRQLDDFAQNYSDDDKYLMFKCKVIETIIYLANISQDNKEIRNQDIVAVLIDYIQAHLKDNLTLQNISEELNYSESYLSNIFKKTMKCSLMKYIRSKKIFLAQRMIQEGQKAIDVAEELNFNDYSTFYRIYVRIIGTSPNNDKVITKVTN